MFQVIRVEPDINIRLPPSCDVNRSFVCRSHVICRRTDNLIVISAAVTESVQQTVKRVRVLGRKTEVIHKVVTTQRSEPSVRVVARL